MAHRPKPPHVETWRDRHGRVRIYFRRDKGARIPLPGPIGSPEFKAAYAAALAGDLKPGKPRRASETPGTIAALCAAYMRSAEFTSLRDTTKRGYLWRLEAIRVPHGHRSVAGMQRAGILAILAPYADRPGQYTNLLKMLRILIRHAIAIGWLDRDPSLGIKRPKAGEIRAWSEDEIERFEEQWPIGTRQRLAFALMLHTGQRRSDVHRMTWADVEGNAIRVVQQKTGARLVIALHSDLRAILQTTEREHVTILNTETGRPFTVAGFSNFMRDAIAAAGLPVDARPHGLRKAAGRRLAEAGCSANEIMAVLGHRTLAEAERYTRDANQTTLATAAVTRLEDRKANKNAQTGLPGLGKSPKT